MTREQQFSWHALWASVHGRSYSGKTVERVGGVSWGRGRSCLPRWMGKQDTSFPLSYRLSFVISVLQLEVQGEVIPLNSKLAEEDADVLKGCISANSCLFYSWKLTYVHILDEVLEDQIRSNRTQNVTQDQLSQEARDDQSPRTVATWDSDVKVTSLHVNTQLIQVSIQLLLPLQASISLYEDATELPESHDFGQAHRVLGWWLLYYPFLMKQVLMLIGKVMTLFHFIFRKKNHWALDVGDSWSVWDVGRYFFPGCFRNRADGCLLDDIRGHGWSTPAVDHVTRFTMGKTECFLSVPGFPWPPASMSPIAVWLNSYLPPSFWSSQPWLPLGKTITTYLLQDVQRNAEELQESEQLMGFPHNKRRASCLERWQVWVKGGLRGAHPPKWALKRCSKILERS